MATLAPSLVALRDEVDARWPKRSRSSDGWIGDPAHAARKSHHNPDKKGMVHAIDITVTRSTQGAELRDAVLKATIGDERVWYVIHAGKIYSKTHGWTARKYNGPNPHNTHIHVSIDYNRVDENDRSRWLDTAPVVPPVVTYVVKRGDTLSSIAEQFNTSWQKLHKMNVSVIGTNPNVITPGMALRVK